MEVTCDWLNGGEFGLGLWQSLEVKILVPETTVNPPRTHVRNAHTNTHITHARWNTNVKHTRYPASKHLLRNSRVVMEAAYRIRRTNKLSECDRCIRGSNLHGQTRTTTQFINHTLKGIQETNQDQKIGTT